MQKATPVLEVENPHFTVKLYENLLRIDLKGSFKNEVEEALENKPVLKETIGGLLGIFVPLHIRLIDIESVDIGEAGKVKVNLPNHRHIVIQLEKQHAENFVAKLNQLVQKAKTREIKERVMRNKVKRKALRKSKGTPPSSYVTVPYYFPTEQVDIVDKLWRKKGKRKKRAQP
ncbi:MAG: hypothetical protein ACP5IM_06925 [Candidatus Bathyarchaeia archaeon]